MGYLERRGDMWLKTDKNGQPEYGFYAPGKEGNHLVKFIPMTDAKIDEIILPYAIGKEKISDDKLKTAAEVLSINDPKMPTTRKLAQRMVAKYLKGETVIEPYCFSGCIKEGDTVSIVAPFSQSIAISFKAFDYDVLEKSPVKLVLPNSDLLYVHSRAFDGTNYEGSAWALIGNSAVNGAEIFDLDEMMFCNKNKPYYLGFDFEVIKPNGDGGDSAEMSL